MLLTSVKSFAQIDMEAEHGGFILAKKKGKPEVINGDVYITCQDKEKNKYRLRQIFKLDKAYFGVFSRAAYGKYNEEWNDRLMHLNVYIDTANSIIGYQQSSLPIRLFKLSPSSSAIVPYKFKIPTIHYGSIITDHRGRKNVNFETRVVYLEDAQMILLSWYTPGYGRLLVAGEENAVVDFKKYIRYQFNQYSLFRDGGGSMMMTEIELLREIIDKMLSFPSKH
ncbi:MAG: hypothetical protein ACI81T_001049 [Bacteroidia bacterium]|jgi:hypothetical protein